MYYDLLVKIRNAVQARKRMFRVQFSVRDYEVAKLLASYGYIKEARKKTTDKKHFLEIDLHTASGGHAIKGFKFISKPNRRIYMSYRLLKPVRQGYGIGVLSTSRGIMTIADAKKQKVGGEYLFELW